MHTALAPRHAPRVNQTSRRVIASPPSAVLITGALLDEGRSLAQAYDAAYQADQRLQLPESQKEYLAAQHRFAFWSQLRLLGTASLPSATTVGAAGFCEMCERPKQRADVKLCLECGAFEDSVPEQIDGEQVYL